VKRTALIATAALFAALTPLAAAGTRIQSVDASSFPALRVIVVAPIGAKTPRISENGHPVSGVTAVNLGGTKSIVLAIDRSQSMRGRPLSNALAAAQSFVGAARAQDHVGVVAFGRSAVGLTRISATPAEARDQLAGMTVDPKAGTALYDAIVVAADRLGQDERPGRAIVVVTDGKDVSSLHSLKDAIRAAQNARTAVYTIGIAGPAFTPTALREIAKQTGGSYREASSSRELTATYAALRSELAHTWQVSYLTSARPGATISLTAAVAKQGRARFTTTLPTEEASSADKPTSLIPAIGYDAAGTAVIGLVVGGLILLACFFWYASQRESRIRSRIDPHLATEAKTGKARRQQSRAATRAHLVDSIENVFANVRQFKQIAQMIERADLPLRPGELLAICAGAAFLLGVVAAVAGASPVAVRRSAWSRSKRERVRIASRTSCRTF
jgi:Mg-chelatase subunit ChlD